MAKEVKIKRGSQVFARERWRTNLWVVVPAKGGQPCHGFTRGRESRAPRLRRNLIPNKNSVHVNRRAKTRTFSLEEVAESDREPDSDQSVVPYKVHEQL